MVICINTGFIVSFNGPFPCGSHNDRRIFNMSLKHDLEEWESVVADGGYRGEKATTPTGFNGYYDKIKATVRA